MHSTPIAPSILPDWKSAPHFFWKQFIRTDNSRARCVLPQNMRQWPNSADFWHNFDKALSFNVSSWKVNEQALKEQMTFPFPLYWKFSSYGVCRGLLYAHQSHSNQGVSHNLFTIYPTFFSKFFRGGSRVEQRAVTNCRGIYEHAAAACVGAGVVFNYFGGAFWLSNCIVGGKKDSPSAIMCERSAGKKKAK